MNVFTKAEKALIIKNAKGILEFIKKEAIPHLKTNMNFRYHIERGTKELVLNLYPGSSEPITMYRGHDYIFDPESKEAKSNSYNYFFYEGNVREMMALLDGWIWTKEKILNQIEDDKRSVNFLNSFTV